MKKMLIIEIVVLVILLITAIVVCSGMSQPTIAPEKLPDETNKGTQSSTQTTTTQSTTLPETTEPEPTWMVHPANRTLTCQQYFVYDVNAGTFLSTSGNASERVYPASITKLYTAYTALQYLKPQDVITADSVLDKVVWGSSVADIQLGDSLTVEQLIEAMLLPSGNDAAYVLAAAAGRAILNQPTAGSTIAVEMFMAEMNAKAVSLGMMESHFVNPDGIHDSQHYMSFQDLATLGKLALENPTIMKYANLAVGNNPNYTPPAEGATESTEDGAPKQWKNTNELIHPESEYYCPYAVGLKTGQTPAAGSCLLSAFDYKGEKFVIGVFGCPEVDDRFDDTLQLFNKTIGVS